ncbi:MAG: twin-arginine translocase subunit TatB [Chromatiaceae bacterium]|nr:twin-arginine translocase subunit TatB [Chromatiaceae bacterium]
MMEWGFWELVLIAVVALVVIGPERLPRIARVAGLWVGKARRTLSSVKHEIDRELKADELRQIVEQQGRSMASHSILETPDAASSKPAASAGATPSASSTSARSSD